MRRFLTHMWLESNARTDFLTIGFDKQYDRPVYGLKLKMGLLLMKRTTFSFQKVSKPLS